LQCRSAHRQRYCWRRRHPYELEEEPSSRRILGRWNTSKGHRQCKRREGEYRQVDTCDAPHVKTARNHMCKQEDAEQGALKEDHARVPHHWRPTELGKHELGDHWFERKQKKGTTEQGGTEDGDGRHRLHLRVRCRQR